MESLLLSNPSTRALMDSNPDLRRALLDPDQLRSVMAAARNPGVAQQQMRSLDLQMRNIQNVPGGIEALSRMMTEVGQPLEDSLREGLVGGGQAGTSAAARAEAAAAAIQRTGSATAALPNPWAGTPPSPSSLGACSVRGLFV